MNYLDTHTVGRWPARIQPKPPAEDWTDRKDEAPLLLFFDGKSFTPIGEQRGGNLFTGYTSLVAYRTSKLQHNDLDYAIAYVQCEYAFRCVNIIADDIAGIPVGVRRIRDKESLPNHPLLQAMTWARKLYRQNILALWQKSLRVFGETYIEPTKPFEHLDLFTGARWLNPIAVEPVVIYGTLQRFDYNGGQRMVQYALTELVYDKIDSLLDDIRGQSLIGAALDAINIDREAKRYMLDNFLKDMRMSGILTGRQGTNLGQQDLDAAVAKLKEQKGSRIVAIAPALEYHQVQQELDSSQLAVSDDVRRRITTALGIPMSITGAWDDAKYQSAPEQRKHYYENVILRECSRHMLVVNDVWLPFYDESGETEFYYDTSEIMALLEDGQAKAALVNSRITGMTMTINEGREALGDEPLPGGDVLAIPSGVVLVPKDQLANANTLLQPAAPASSILPAVALATDSVVVNDMPGAQSACLMLTMSAQATTDLIGLQQDIRGGFYASAPVDWNAPDTFHVTLLLAPNINEAQIAALSAALEDVDVPDMALNVGSLRVFEKPGEYAIHFRIRRNTDLYDLQEILYDLCIQLGIPLSSFSQPSMYTPHITMGYSSIKPPGVPFTTKLRVKPAELQLQVNDAVVWRKSLDGEEPYIRPDPVPKSAQLSALEELAAWRKKAENVGAAKATSFKNYLIRDELADVIRAALAEASDKAEIKAVFERAYAVITYKAIDGTQADFEGEFGTLLSNARGGSVNKRSFSASLRALLNRYGRRAYTDGLAAGGIDDEMDEDDKAAFALILAEQSRYVSALADTLYADEDTITAAMAEQKPTLWWNKSVKVFYTEGLLAADKNGLYEWEWGPTEHCATCNRLNGQKHRLKDWAKKGLLPQSASLDCGGFNCKCSLKRASGKARGSW